MKPPSSVFLGSDTVIDHSCNCEQLPGEMYPPVLFKGDRFCPVHYCRHVDPDRPRHATHDRGDLYNTTRENRVMWRRKAPPAPAQCLNSKGEPQDPCACPETWTPDCLVKSLQPGAKVPPQSPSTSGEIPEPIPLETGKKSVGITDFSPTGEGISISRGEIVNCIRSTPDEDPNGIDISSEKACEKTSFYPGAKYKCSRVLFDPNRPTAVNVSPIPREFNGIVVNGINTSERGKPQCSSSIIESCDPLKPRMISSGTGGGGVTKEYGKFQMDPDEFKTRQTINFRPMSSSMSCESLEGGDGNILSCNTNQSSIPGVPPNCPLT